MYPSLSLPRREGTFPLADDLYADAGNRYAAALGFPSVAGFTPNWMIATYVVAILLTKPDYKNVWGFVWWQL